MEKDKVREKIKKLLKISVLNGATEEEAINALKIATKLMTQYQIEAHELNRSDSELKKVMFEPQSHFVAVKALIIIIAEHFDCFILGFKHQKKLCVVGFDIDVEVFMYMKDYVEDVLISELQEHRKMLLFRQNDGISTKTKNKNFCEGFSSAIGYNLSQAKSKQEKEIKSKTGFDLVVQKKNDIKNKLQSEIPGLKKEKEIRYDSKTNTVDHYSFLAGYQVGSKVELNRQVEVIK